MASSEAQRGRLRIASSLDLPAGPSLQAWQRGWRLAARPEVTAVFVSNDQMALGLLRALHEAGRRVPDDVSVVGYDDIPEAAHLLPPLTTIRTDFPEIGRRALRLLLTQLDDPEDAGEALERDPVIPVELIVRNSTGAAR